MLEPREGGQIAGRYSLMRELARGGMGSVWVATDAKLQRQVAVKILAGPWGRSPGARRRFEREAMSIAQLQCPNVVQVFDYGIEQDTPFIVMELLRGEDLQTRLRRERRISLADTTEIIWQTAKALGVAHGAGIVHRDLKPGNLFIAAHSDEPIVKVLDFGVAKTMGELDGGDAAPGAIMGTPQYMSPEQGRGYTELIDHRTDLWALAVVAYRALTGRVPFRGEDAADVIVNVCTRPLVEATKVAPDLPHDVDYFFETALAKEPEQRFSSAKELATAFASASSAAMPSLRLPEPRRPISTFPARDSQPSMRGLSGDWTAESRAALGVRRSVPPPLPSASPSLPTPRRAPGPSLSDTATGYAARPTPRSKRRHAMLLGGVLAALAFALVMFVSLVFRDPPQPSESAMPASEPVRVDDPPLEASDSAAPAAAPAAEPTVEPVAEHAAAEASSSASTATPRRRRAPRRRSAAAAGAPTTAAPPEPAAEPAPEPAPRQPAPAPADPFADRL